MDKQYFAGANTPDGFFSYFKYIINPKDAERIYIIKGGSGVGKSTAVEKIAKHLKDKGNKVEFIRCSADKDSFDGICVPALKIAVIDGTAPHVIDPTMPGASEVIVNLGEFLDVQKLKENKDEIASIIAQKGELYKNAYGYMKSASFILQLNNEVFAKTCDNYKLMKLSLETAKRIFTDDLGKEGSIRKLFTEAFTSEGFVDYSNTLTAGCMVFCMDVELRPYAAILMDYLAKYAVCRGYNIECYYDTMEPNKIRHILIPDLKIVILGGISDEPKASHIALSEVFDAEKQALYKETIEKNSDLYNQILACASDELKKGKEHHKNLEAIYSSAMDFKMADKVVSEICALY